MEARSDRPRAESADPHLVVVGAVHRARLIVPDPLGHDEAQRAMDLREDHNIIVDDPEHPSPLPVRNAWICPLGGERLVGEPV